MVFRWMWMKYTIHVRVSVGRSVNGCLTNANKCIQPIIFMLWTKKSETKYGTTLDLWTSCKKNSFFSYWIWIQWVFSNFQSRSWKITNCTPKIENNEMLKTTHSWRYIYWNRFYAIKCLETPIVRAIILPTVTRDPMRIASQSKD